MAIISTTRRLGISPAQRASPQRGLSLKSSICTIALLLFTVGNAQYFADFKYQANSDKASGGEPAGRRDARGNLNGDQSNMSKLDGTSSIWDYMAAASTDYINQGAFEAMRRQVGQVYGMLSKDPATLRENNKLHRKRGALRSGNGDPDETHRRKMMFEERERLEKKVANKEKPENIPESNKMFELWLEKQSDRPGLRQDDKYDLVPHETLYMKAEDVPEEESEDAPEAERLGRRRLHSSINSDNAVSINRLEEPYPTTCHNNGKLSKMTQKYYMCKSLKTATSQMSNQPFRVDADTYTLLHSQYTDQYSCYTQNVENNVCVCPTGTVDFLCATELYTRCYINITNPAFYEGCTGTDSFFYIYSIPGFSPCVFQNFTDPNPRTVQFDLNCQQLSTTGLVNMQKEPDMGYPYRDVIKEPLTNSVNYISSSPETEFSLKAPVPKVTVQFDFRDMKYLSTKKSFVSKEMDVTVNGTTHGGEVEINFTKLSDEDATGNSRYIVGGRTYFEASAFSASTQPVTSFTFRGFFDEENYQEPKSTLNQLKSSGWLYVIIIAAIVVLVALIWLACYCTKKKGNEERQSKKKSE